MSEPLTPEQVNEILEQEPPIPPAALALVRHIESQRLPGETYQEAFDRWMKRNTPSGWRKE